MPTSPERQCEFFTPIWYETFQGSATGHIFPCEFGPTGTAPRVTFLTLLLAPAS
jgi:hypothetical protein